MEKNVAVPPKRASKRTRVAGVLAVALAAAALGGCGASVARSTPGSGGAAGSASTPASGSGPARGAYFDPAGDAQVADVVAVSVSREPLARLAFLVTFTGDPPLAWDAQAGTTDMVWIMLDIDRDAATTPEPDESAEWAAADYIVGVHAASIAQGPGVWSRWQGTLGPFPDGPRLGDAAMSGRQLRVTVPASLVGDPTSFGMRIVTSREEAETGKGARGDTWPDAGWQTVTPVAS